MTEQERFVITSNDYADFILDYSNNPKILEQYSQGIIQTINEAYAVVYLPMEQLNEISIATHETIETPNLLGLASEVALEASGVKELQAIPTFNLTGNGVLIGIVDTGINYQLPVFKKADGTSKILAIWDQTIQGEDYPSDALFGTEYRSEQINQAIVAENPLELVPSIDENGHGTMVAAIAVGAANDENNFSGVAPGADLLVVKLLQAKDNLRNFFVIPPGVICYQENSVMWGVQYLIETARELNRPLAICIAVGTSQDAHDGNSPLSMYLSSAADSPRTVVVTAVGNEGNRGRHFHGIIDPEIGSSTVELNVGENEVGFTMELWGDSPGIFSMDILSPSGEYIPRIGAGLRVSRTISFIFDETVINVEYQTLESRTGDQRILLRFHNVSSGIWRFNVYGQGNLSTGFNVWLPMGDFITDETYFVQPDIYTTIIAPGTSTFPITVTAYNPVNSTLYVNSSRGYSRSGIIKPELAAPGVNYTAPALNGEFKNFSGTGVASAHTTGVVALALEWAVVRKNEPNISTLEVKNYLIRGAKRRSNLSYPNRDWGFGILDIFNTFDVLRSGS